MSDYLPRRRDARRERDARLAARHGDHDDSASASMAGGPRAEAPPAAPVRCIGDEGPWCVVVPEAPGDRPNGHDRDVLGAARQLADQIGGGVMVVTTRGGAARAEYAVLGVDRLVEYPAAQHLALLAHLLIALDVRHCLFPDTVIGGGYLARAMAVRCQLPVATAVVRFSPSKLLRRGDNGRLEQTLPPVPIMALLPEAAAPVTTAVHEARCPNWTLPVAFECEAPSDPVVLDVRPGDALTTPLAEADVIVGGGAGVSDWPALCGLATRLGAVVGATRAICDAGVMPRDRQIGVSGTLVAPRCYLALGISGAAQHLQGITDCQRVVAVNTDLHAAMVRRADLAIIADAQAVMAALLARLEKGS